MLPNRISKAVRVFDQKLAEAEAAGERLVVLLRKIFPEADIYLGDWELGFDAVTIRYPNEDYPKDCYRVPIATLMDAITGHKPKCIYWNALDLTEDEAIAVLRRVGWEEAVAREWVEKHRYWYD